MQGHDIIVIGASVGGIQALSSLVSQLPADLASAVFVVLHLASDVPSVLDEILDRKGPLKAVKAIDGEAIHHGCIYVAPPDHHLLVKRDHVRVVRGPKENRWRPAVDPLFRSAAVAYGPRVVGVVLSGYLDDGTAGMLAVKRCGGVTMVQSPDEAISANMPQSVLDHMEVDYCIPIADMSRILQQLTRQFAPEAPPVGDITSC
jgi:two-component system chemotaxis response regulator CheB